MNALFATLLLANPLGSAYGLLELNHSSGLQLHLNDDIQQSFGNTAAAPDYWFVHTSTNDFELRSTDVDGGGTDGIIFKIDDGTNVFDFGGGAVLAGTLLMPDTTNLSVGSGEDYRLIYRSANTAFLFETTDDDGGGTNGVIWHVQDGEPHFYLGELNQGVRFNSNSDGNLILTDESGSGLILRIDAGELRAPVVRSQGNSVDLSMYTGDVSAAGQSGDIYVYTGDQSNAGASTNSGEFEIGTGDVAGSGAVGALQLYTGAAAGGAANRGDIIFYFNGSPAAGTEAMRIDASANEVIVGNDLVVSNDLDLSDATQALIRATSQGAELAIGAVAQSGAAAGGDMVFFTGNQTNGGNYASGNVKIYTGSTTTDGDSGDVQLYSGVAGAGAADAGDVVVSVNGAPGTGTTGLSVAGASGSLEIARLSQEDAPGSCTTGEIILDNGGATLELCYCQTTNTWVCAAMAAGPAD